MFEFASPDHRRVSSSATEYRQTARWQPEAAAPCGAGLALFLTLKWKKSAFILSSQAHSSEMSLRPNLRGAVRMENWQDPLEFLTSTSSSFHWFHLAFYLGVTLAVVCISRKVAPSVALRAFGQSYDVRQPSIRADVVICLANLALIFPPITLLHWRFGETLTHAFDPSTPRGWWTFAPGYTLESLIHAFVMVVAFDFGAFLGHYLSHKIPLLFHFHSVHHSATSINVFTSYRKHPIDYVVRGAITVAVIVLATAGLNIIFPYRAPEMSFWGANVFFFLYIMTVNFQHSHVAIHYPRWLRGILLSPHLHLLHHSAAARHFDKNLGSLFPHWDRWFGTYIDEDVDEAKICYGLSETERGGHALTNLFFGPIKSALWPRPGKNKTRLHSEAPGLLPPNAQTNPTAARGV